MRALPLLIILVLTVSLAWPLLAQAHVGGAMPAGVSEPVLQKSLDPLRTVFLDTSHRSVKVVGEDVGEREGRYFAGWYTDTVAYDPYSGQFVVAWLRVDESGGSDAVYVALLKPEDLDGDGHMETTLKRVVRVALWKDIYSVDSVSVGALSSSGSVVLVTWTETEKDGRQTDVWGALIYSSGEVKSFGIAQTPDVYDEYSRSCYVPELKAFLVVWYRSDTEEVWGRWIYVDGRLGKEFKIGDTGLSYEYADQMMCIGGSSKALVVYRAPSPLDGGPTLRGALVSETGVTDVKGFYDSSHDEETIGVRGAYTSGYFLVPVVVGAGLRYDIVYESDGTVENRDYVTSVGSYPYAIGLSDRFVMVWINEYNNPDGDPAIANIDLTDFYIHPIYGVPITSDDYKDLHPFIAYDSSSGRILCVWTRLMPGGGYDIMIAEIDPGKPEDSPKVVSAGPIEEAPGDQIAVGFAVLSKNNYAIVFTDTSDGEEDLLAHVEAPFAAAVKEYRAYILPGDSDRLKHDIISLIDSAKDRVYVATSFFSEEKLGEPGTISRALADAASRIPRGVAVIMDDDERNDKAYEFFLENKVTAVKASYKDPRHIMHEKFIVVDDTVFVMTNNIVDSEMSLNNDTAVAITCPALAEVYAREFNNMLNGLFGPSKRYDNSAIIYGNYGDRGVAFEIYFSPQERGDALKLPSVITGFIDRAWEIVLFSSYVFSTSSLVQDVREALVGAYDRSVKVVGVFDRLLNAKTPGKALYELIARGLGGELFINTHPGKVHAKLFVIDRGLAIIGSYNPTSLGTRLHDETILVIRDPSGELIKPLTGFLFGMIEDNRHFARVTEAYRADWPVIAAVAFNVDGSGSPGHEWVIVYNPASHRISLAGYYIGDIDVLWSSSKPYDDEGLYRFPSTASIPPRSAIVIAYSGERFYEMYGFYPDYEIDGSSPRVPDLIHVTDVDGDRVDEYTGSWNLSDSGDEVLLLYREHSFFYVIDAVWYGDTSYDPSSYVGSIDTTGMKPGQVLERTDFTLDSLAPASVFTGSTRSYSNSKPSLSRARMESCSKIVVGAGDPDGDRVSIVKIIVNGSIEIDGGEIDASALAPGVYVITGVAVAEDNALASMLKERAGRSVGPLHTIALAHPIAFAVVGIGGVKTIARSEYGRILAAYYSPDTRTIHIEVEAKTIVSIGIPPGYRISRVLVNGVPTTQYIYNATTGILTVDPPDTIDVVLAKTGGVGGQRGLGGVAKPIQPYTLLAIALALSLAIAALAIARKALKAR